MILSLALLAALSPLAAAVEPVFVLSSLPLARDRELFSERVATLGGFSVNPEGTVRRRGGGLLALSEGLAILEDARHARGAAVLRRLEDIRDGGKSEASQAEADRLVALYEDLLPAELKEEAGIGARERHLSRRLEGLRRVPAELAFDAAAAQGPAPDSVLPESPSPSLRLVRYRQLIDGATYVDPAEGTEKPYSPEVKNLLRIMVHRAPEPDARKALEALVRHRPVIRITGDLVTGRNGEMRSEGGRYEVLLRPSYVLKQQQGFAPGTDGAYQHFRKLWILMDHAPYYEELLGTVPPMAVFDPNAKPVSAFDLRGRRYLQFADGTLRVLFNPAEQAVDLMHELTHVAVHASGAGGSRLPTELAAYQADAELALGLLDAYPGQDVIDEDVVALARLWERNPKAHRDRIKAIIGREVEPWELGSAAEREKELRRLLALEPAKFEKECAKRVERFFRATLQSSRQEVEGLFNLKLVTPQERDAAFKRRETRLKQELDDARSKRWRSAEFRARFEDALARSAADRLLEDAAQARVPRSAKPVLPPTPPPSPILSSN